MVRGAAPKTGRRLSDCRRAMRTCRFESSARRAPPSQALPARSRSQGIRSIGGAYDCPRFISLRFEVTAGGQRIERLVHRRALVLVWHTRPTHRNIVEFDRRTRLQRVAQKRLRQLHAFHAPRHRLERRFEARRVTLSLSKGGTIVGIVPRQARDDTVVGIVPRVTLSLSKGGTIVGFVPRQARDDTRARRDNGFGGEF